MAFEVVLQYLMTELYVIGDIQLKSGPFDELLLLITFPLEVSIHRAMNATLGDVFEESHCTKGQQV